MPQDYDLDPVGYLEEIGSVGEDYEDDLQDVDVVQESHDDVTVDTVVDERDELEQDAIKHPLAISIKQKPDTKIFNKSAIFRVDPLHQYIYEQEKILQENVFDDVDEFSSSENDEIAPPRALQGMVELCERYRRNFYMAIDTDYDEKRKRNKITLKKLSEFKLRGHKQIATAVKQHIDALVRQGKIHRFMFENYNHYYKECIEKSGDDALYAGMNLVLCAEVVAPSIEMINPVKRITASLPTGV